MKKIIICLLLALMLCSCKTEESNDAKGILYTYEISFDEFEKAYNENSDKWVCGIFAIDDLNVKDDEILLDIYSKEENGSVYVGLKEDYDKLSPSQIENSLISCPSVDYKLDKDGEYTIVMINSNEPDYAMTLNLEFGKHYVISFGDAKTTIERYS